MTETKKLEFADHEMVEVPIDQLRSDKYVVTRGYQRTSIRQYIVDKIVSDFRESRLGTIYGSWGDHNGGQDPDYMYIYDGWHRITALEILGYTYVEIQVQNLTVAEQAEEFWRLNVTRTPTTPFQNHVAKLQSGDVDAIEVQQIVHSFGLAIVPSRKYRGIASIRALERLQASGFLEDALDVIVDAFGVEDPAIGFNELLDGMWKFMKAHKKQIEVYPRKGWKHRLSARLADQYGTAGVIKRLAGELSSATPGSNRGAAMKRLLTWTWDKGLKIDSTFRILPVEEGVT